MACLRDYVAGAIFHPFSSFIAPSTSTTMPGVLSKPVWLPPEVMTHILQCSLYSGREFASGLEYEDITSHNHPFAIDHSWFASSVLRVSKKMYCLSVGILWRFVVIRTRESLRKVLGLALRGGYLFGPGEQAKHTRRLQLRLSGPYNPKSVVKLLSCMPQLKVFALRNEANPPDQPFRLTPRLVAEALAESCTQLVRVQFDSPEQLLEACDIRWLLASLPDLRSLRVFNLSTYRPGSPPATLDPNTRTHLTFLSVGSDNGAPGESLDVSAMTTFMSMLASAPLLPHLVKAHLLTWTAGTAPFLAAYGRQLRFLLYSTSIELGLDEVNFLDQCPMLRKLVWMDIDYTRLDPSQQLPMGHGKLVSITLVFVKFGDGMPDAYTNHIQTCLSRLVDGNFRRLKTVCVMQRGTHLGSLERTTWFRYYGRCFTKKGIQLVARE